MSAGAPSRARRPPRRLAVSTAVLFAAMAVSLACNGSRESEGPVAALPARADPLPAYPVSPRGGTPASGPGGRYNHCERIWCIEHQENFFIDHFLSGHEGYVLHDESVGDVFAPRLRDTGPPLPHANRAALRLCGKHAHPWLLGRGGGPIRHTGFNRNLGFSRAHFDAYGTRLEPCCVNGLGSAYVHSRNGRLFPFHDVSYYRAHPEWGWSRPFKARPASGG